MFSMCSILANEIVLLICISNFGFCSKEITTFAFHSHDEKAPPVASRINHAETKESSCIYFKCQYFLSFAASVRNSARIIFPQITTMCCCKTTWLALPSRVAQPVGHLTRKSGVLGSIPGLATYFRFSFRFFKKGSCQLLAKVCVRSTG